MRARLAARGPVTKMSAGHYQLVASIIRQIEDRAERKRVSDHFGKAFNERSAVFDFYQWRKATHTDEALTP
jgi:hypothetical protein